MTRRLRALERRLLLAALGPCDNCGHPWLEHPGSGWDADRAGMCRHVR